MPIRFKIDFYSVALVLLAVSALVLLIGTRRKSSFFLRASAYGLLLWFMLEPILSHIPSFNTKPVLAVLVDESKSMSIEDPVSRIGEVKRVLAKSRDSLEDHFDVSYFAFSQNSAKIDGNDLEKLRPEGGITDILGSVEQVLRERKQDNPAILLFSDGTQNSLEQSVSQKVFDTKIFCVGAGDSRGISDLALKNLQVSDFAFKNHPVELAVKIGNFGYPRKTVSVNLKEVHGSAKNLIASQEVRLDENGTESDAQFKFTPKSVGTQEYEVEVPVQPGEISKSNNTLRFSLEVGREKIRVLYLCGQPSPEYSFLRQILKTDPSIELVSFVILRNPEDVVPVPDDQLSLIPFPTNDIFVRTLQEFDLLVFENFSYSRFGILTSHLDNIQSFIENRGGGFLMIGGQNSFGLGGYQGTAIERILPVVIGGGETVLDEPLTLRVLESQHQIFDVTESLAETQRFWKGLAPLNGFHKLVGAKPAASVLATVQETGTPAIAGWQRGKGRVLAVTTLSTWQWALAHNYSQIIQFWRQVFRWLTTTGESRPVRIIFTEPQAKVGQKLTVKCLVQPEKLKTLDNLHVQLAVYSGSREVQSLPLIASGRLEYRGEWMPSQEGVFTFKAAASTRLDKVQDSRDLEVILTDVEMENPHPDHDFLRQLAEKNGGEYFDAKTFSPAAIVGKIKAKPAARALEAEKSLWENPWLFLSAVLVLVLEWGLRRYRGEI